MAARYLNSGASTPTSPYTSNDWTLAAQKLNDIDGVDTAGDVIYIASTHNETTALGANKDFSFAGTISSPQKFLSCNTGAAPPTALAAGAVIEYTGAYWLRINHYAYWYGVTFKAGSGGVSWGALTFASNNPIDITFEDCSFYEDSGVSNGGIGFANYSAYGIHVLLKNCAVKMSNTGQSVKIVGCDIDGLSWISGTAATTTAFTISAGFRGTLRNIDFTGLPSNVTLFGGTNSSYSSGTLYLYDSKLPASWSGNLVTATMTVGQRIEMHNCDSGDTNYRIWIEDYLGTIKQDTGVYLDSGITDGTTNLSYKFVSNSYCNNSSGRFYGPEFHIWNDNVAATTMTASVEIVHNSQGTGTGNALTNKEIWLEVTYLDTSGFPIGNTVSNIGDLLGSATDHATSSETWTGDAAGWDTQKLSVTLSPVPAEKGSIIARVVMGIAGKTVYVDPNVTITAT